MRIWPALLLLACAAALSGCLERTNSGAGDQAYTGGWELAGEFGGDAEIASASQDPLERRYKTGGFRLISGLDATEDEVWVCDLDVSRIQVFNYNGRVLRTIGSGVDAAAALPSDVELYEETRTVSRTNPARWEDSHGTPWAAAYRTNFRAADVCVRPDGYWLADQTRTSALRHPVREPGVMFIPDEGEVEILPAEQLVWPSQIAALDDQITVADNRANFLLACRFTTDPWDMNWLQRGGSFNNLMALEVQFSTNAQYSAQHNRFTVATSAPGGTYLPGGMAYGFGKLAVCDTMNRRIQLYEARTDNPNWGKVLREIKAEDRAGARRFESPLDIEIAADGTVFVCDRDAGEIVVLDPTFARLGAFGGNELVEPYALALSPDGLHCFVTDRRSNKVYHYARPE